MEDGFTVGEIEWAKRELEVTDALYNEIADSGQEMPARLAAEKRALKSRWRRAILKHHPDRNPEDEKDAAKKVVLLNKVLPGVSGA